MNLKPVELVEIKFLKKLPVVVKDNTENRGKKIESDIHEFRRRGLNNKPNRWCECLSCLDRVPRWLLWTGLGLLVYGAVAFFISTMIVYFYSVQAQLRPIFPVDSQVPGASCSSTSNCIRNSYCVKPTGSSVGTCQCSTNYYYDPAVWTGGCSYRKSFNNTCSSSAECLTSVGLTCIISSASWTSCLCNTNVYFWNTTSMRCQYLRGLNEYCTASSQCITQNAQCSNSRCQCYSNFYFNTLTGKCVQKLLQNVACSASTYCINRAYCGLNSGDTFAQCHCDPLLYYFQTSSSSCQVRLSTLNAACNDYDACDLYTNNLRCFNGQCACDPTYEAWNSNYTQCLNLYRYSKTCLLNAPYFGCITGAPHSLTCAAPDNGGIRDVCRCTSQQYYDVLVPGCTTLKQYNVTCDKRSECDAYAQCVTYGSGSSQKRCICMDTYSYYDPVTKYCLPKNVYGWTGCSQDYQCQDYAGLVCSGSKCDCPSTQFYNTSTFSCQWKARRYDFCVADEQCYNNDCKWLDLSGTFIPYILYQDPYCDPIP